MTTNEEMIKHLKKQGLMVVPTKVTRQQLNTMFPCSSIGEECLIGLAVKQCHICKQELSTLVEATNNAFKASEKLQETIPIIVETPKTISKQSGSTVTVNCKTCDSPFTARVADRKRGWAIYCSKRCKAKMQKWK